MKRQAFTLIELLIVVAVIGILAAIAVPNFLNAQIRAKVARVQSDFKALEKGLEQYFMDNNAYPYTDLAHANIPYPLNRLTSPVAYLSQLPQQDPFLHQDASQRYSNIWMPYLLVTFPQQAFYGVHDPSTGSLRLGPLRWFLNSVGPDKRYDPYDYGTSANYWLPYTPTNGLISRGELFMYGPGGVLSHVATSNTSGRAPIQE